MKTFQIVLIAALAFGPAISGAKTVATVGQTPITERQVIAQVMELMPQVSFHGKITDAMITKLRKQALEQVIEEELLYAEAKRLGLEPTDKQLQIALGRKIKRAGGEQKFTSKLLRQHMTKQSFLVQLKRRLGALAALQRVVATYAAKSDAEVKAYYDQNPKQFVRPAEVKLAQALFRLDPKRPVETKKAALALATAFLKTLQAGASFQEAGATLLQKHPKTVQVEDLGWIHTGRLIPALETAAFKLRVGELSAPVDTFKGYVVLKAEGEHPAAQIPFGEVSKSLKKRLIQEDALARRAALIAQLKKRIPVKRLK